MIEIFVDQISARLIYTLDFVFHEREISYKLNNDYLSFENSTLPKFNYSDFPFEKIPQLLPSAVLFDEEVFLYNIEKSQFGAEECLSFDQVTDPLAAIFYVLSRMEEYSNFREDEHGRFLAKYSVLSQFNWLHKAVCDRWAVAFILYLSKELGIEIPINIGKVSICPTFDIDNTYAYQWKQGFRKWFSMGRDFIKRDQKRIIERKEVLAKKAKDPYDTYAYIESIADRGFKVQLFWLLGDYANFDKNISHGDLRHQKLIARMNQVVKVNLHPSYKSNLNEYSLRDEKVRLEQILDEPVHTSRQHYLKMKVRTTYPRMLAQEFMHDYSMGFADQVGFRSGTARSHSWFNLNTNESTELTIHPFVYMDGTLNEYLNLSVQESKNVIWQLYTEVARFGGDFTFIWHNETIGDYGKWSGWREVLEFTLKLKDR